MSTTSQNPMLSQPTEPFVGFSPEYVDSRLASSKVLLDASKTEAWLPEDQVWGGLRVRIGMHCGWAESRQVHQGRTVLTGKCVLHTKQVADAVVSGGQVVCSEEVLAEISDELLHSTVIVHLGKYLLKDELELGLVSILPEELAARHAAFLPLKAERQLAPSAFQSPPDSRHTTIVFLHIHKMAALQREMNEVRDSSFNVFSPSGGKERKSSTGSESVSVMAMIRGGESSGKKPANERSSFLGIQQETVFQSEVLPMFEKVVERSLRCMDYSGYIAEAKPGFYLLAFYNPVSASRWAMALQMELMNQVWPEALLESSLGFESQMQIQGRKVRVFNGLRVACGLAFGEVQAVQLHKRTGRAAYFGPTVNTAARVAGLASGGQVLVALNSNEAFLAKYTSMLSTATQVPFTYEDLGLIPMKGLSDDRRIVQIQLCELEYRTFPKVTSKKAWRKSISWDEDFQTHWAGLKGRNMKQIIEKFRAVNGNLDESQEEFSSGIDLPHSLNDSVTEIVGEP